MEVIQTAIEGVCIIEPKVFKDSRGYFFESFSLREFEQKVRPINFVQDNESMSSFGVMRGLHFQKPPYAQSKLALTLFSIYLSTVFKTSHVSVNCVNPGVVKSSMLALNKWMDRIADYFIKPPVDSEAGVIPTMRALESADTGFIFEGRNKQVKMSSVLNNRDVFIKLCNDTMRILKKYLPR